MVKDWAIEIGDVRRHNSLAVARIYAKDKFSEEVTTIDKAIKTNDFSVDETGIIGTLKIVNRLDANVFIACGSLVEGASQNRYSLYPSLIMPHTSVQLPVNCAEQRQGLLRGSRGTYQKSSTIVMPSIRGGDDGQDISWTRIMNTTSILDRMTPSRDYSFAEKNTNLADYISAIGTSKEGQIGIVAGIRYGDQTLFYTDFFGNQKILKRVHPNLAKSFGIVAKVHEGDAKKVSKDDIVDFLKSAKNIEGYKKSHVGGGALYLINRPVKGTILDYHESIVQVTMKQDWKNN